jgi:hypothetical protein
LLSANTGPAAIIAAAKANAATTALPRLAVTRRVANIRHPVARRLMTVMALPSKSPRRPAAGRIAAPRMKPDRGPLERTATN